MKQTEKSLNNEDYVIINGKLSLLDSVEYSVQWDHPMIIWSLSTEDIEGSRKVNLQFNPNLQSLGGPNQLLLKNSCKYLYGEFEGYITDENGKEIEISGVKGLAHVHYIQL